MAQTKKSLTETKEKLTNTISALEAKGLEEPLSQADQDELDKAKAQLMQVEDQLSSMESKNSEKDNLEEERKKLDEEKAALNEEKAALEAEKARNLALIGPTEENYQCPDDLKGVLHLKVSKGPSFNPETGAPIKNWKVITMNQSEWTNLKKCIEYYDYKIEAVLHDPFGDVKTFLIENEFLVENKK